MKKNNNSVSGINMFIQMIYEKVPRKFGTLFKYRSHKRKIEKFRRDIHNGSPSFGVLWKMADFIKLAELIFFYDNSINNKSNLYSSKNYSNDQNGFIIFDEDNNVKIVIKLFNESRRVVLDIERVRKSENSRTCMSFTNDSWDSTPTIYDEMLLEQVIKVINAKMLKLFDDCYSLR